MASRKKTIPTDVFPEDAALHHADDGAPGYTREKRGRDGHRYLDPAGGPLEDAAALARIEALTIPPAWNDVWVCTDAGGHLQATGRDAKKRKVYRYHPRWSERRNQLKFDRLRVFGAALPAIRARVAADLRRRTLDRDRVAAVAVELLQQTLIRIGNEQYAARNQTFGLTTLRDEHVAATTGSLRFTFTGKSGRDHDLTVRDRRLAAAALKLSELPGHRLLQYVGDDGRPHALHSEHVNDYLRDPTGLDFSAKDFRTWFGTVGAACWLLEQDPPLTREEGQKQNVGAIRHAAALLGNTPATCRKYYVHPLIPEMNAEGSLGPALRRLVEQMPEEAEAGLHPKEAAVLSLLLGDEGGRGSA
ncbi:DNA topoisomerase IB [Phycisphaera mikurensis]|uniref:DNA topoisomerase n=1 Tax=Phycisphaera mikurensis (strain NBRC 102666 / KCTC 22515 / FYK2301M01) TaxID=1142394 RepID=I0IBA0_PHYMF|nr:DNA topoisomerase IB [Phycisphaera mikurensis]MBB6443033.1 DNA topoisomerase-1 [Phycisphaera mikurensis]BAM02538.1 putative DNA topoisomerase I [Phycisphaera mikurensis NBRC 102666]